MTGWFLFVGLVSMLIGFAVGLGIGVYFSAKCIVNMVKKGEIIYVDKSEEE